MRYGIFSDIHSNLEALKSVIDAYKEESIDLYLCVGDVVGYGANPVECIEKTRNITTACVAGNHDWASVDKFSCDYFNPYAKAAILWTRQQLDEQDRDFLQSLKLIYKNEDLTLVHGTLYNPQDFGYMVEGYNARDSFGLLENDICFIGHSHTAGVFIRNQNGGIEYTQDNLVKIKEGNKYIVNAGSVGQPRDGNPDSAYCVYDTDKKEVRIKRVKYDTKTAQNKITKAGLPKILGDRLLVGR
jgi:predicted phosphodiesterase